jgi:hypothetical protein
MNNKEVDQVDRAVADLFQIIEDGSEDQKAALAILALMTPTNPDCVNHTPDTWGQCEQCGCSVMPWEV